VFPVGLLNTTIRSTYFLGRYLAGRVPPHFQEIDESAAVEGDKVIVLPSTVVSMLATVIEITPVV
jgi:hypothetical protein